jgi:hypothetical protein
VNTKQTQADANPSGLWATHRLQIMASAEAILKIAEKVCEIDKLGIGKAIVGSLNEIIRAARVRGVGNRNSAMLISHRHRKRTKQNYLSWSQRLKKLNSR